jgi:Fur family ferric uptake transcriptional regulator
MERSTRQTDAIHYVLRAAGRPLSAAELAASAQKSVIGLGIATVYRHLKRMTAQGVLVSIKLPGEPARYELAGKGHHHYFVCDACSSMFEVPVCASDLGKLTPRGFTLERHEIVLYGRCARCAGTAAAIR